MFQYAFARKLQAQNRGNVYLDIRYINNEDTFERGERSLLFKNCSYRDYGLNHFKITLPVADENMLRHWDYLNQRNFIEKLQYNLAKLHLWMFQCKDENKLREKVYISQKTSPVSTYFMGYFFDLEYFSDIKSILKKEFCLKKSISLPSNLYENLKNENTVSIHIRRGDFVKLFWDISRSDYYVRAIQIVKEFIQDPVYMIFSDDINWVKENMTIDGRKFYISGMGFNDYEELMIMKHCKHNIMANSTFSYWAAYLNNNPDKKIICPKHWKSGAIPKDWILI